MILASLRGISNKKTQRTSPTLSKVVEEQPDDATAAAYQVTEGLEVKPNGPAAAAILAAATAIFSLGVMFTLSHSWSALAQWLVFREQVGALSGLSTMTGIIWVLTWAVLTPPLWKRDVPFPWLAAIAAILIVAGLLLTWPPIVQRT
jgi:uncharacterized membrane protein YkgB